MTSKTGGSTPETPLVAAGKQGTRSLVDEVKSGPPPVFPTLNRPVSIPAEAPHCGRSLGRSQTSVSHPLEDPDLRLSLR